MSRTYLILPLVSAFVFAISALSIKRSIQLGMGPWRMVFLSNLFVFFLFSSFIFLAKDSTIPSPLWPAILSGALFFIGQLFTFLALSRGDVSIATPVLGVKVVLVAFFLFFFLDQPIALSVWIASFLASLGIAFLQLGSASVNRGAVLRTVLLALISASAFAATDVLMQRWCPVLGFEKFVPISAAVCLLLSFFLIPLFNAPLWKIPNGAHKYVFIGLILLAIQSMGIALAIGLYKDAAGTNVVYASRGLWSVVVVWVIGHWFANVEKHQGSNALIGRIIGAILILSAVILIFL